MGKVFLTLSMLLGVGALFAQSQQHYQDAVQLSARIAAKMDRSAEIPANYAAELTSALEAIARSSDEAAKTVQKLDIHAFPYANTQEFRLYIDASTKWALRLAKDEVEIEQTPLRDLALMHGLSVHHVKYLNGIVMLAIQSETPKNMRHLANNLSLTDGVIMAEIPAPSGDGHDITAKRYKEGWVISYHYKYYNCQTGCLKSYSWRFGVSNEGRVDFMGSYGEMPQELIDDNIFVMETH